MTYRLAYIALSIIVAAIYLAMVVWSLPEITAEADGMRPFDLRPFGYSAAEAEAFLNALSEEGRVFYAETQHWLDFLFPGLFVAWSLWTIWVLIPGLAGWALMALAVLACVADYSENAAVARLLGAFDADLVATASRWSMAKSAATTVVLVGILWAFGRNVSARLRG